MNPHQIAEERLELAGEYQRDSELLSDILTQKAALWPELRENSKSDKAADNAWNALPLGINEMKLKLKMKSSEKRMSALKTMLEVLTMEAHNSF